MLKKAALLLVGLLLAVTAGFMISTPFSSQKLAAEQPATVVSTTQQNTVAVPPPLVLSATPIQIQIPCMLPQQVDKKACVIVDKTLDGSQESINDRIDFVTAELLRNRINNFAIVYNYEVALQENGAPIVNVTVNGQKNNVTAAVDSQAPVSFWTATDDGGQTWSAVTTNSSAPVYVDYAAS